MNIQCLKCGLSNHPGVDLCGGCNSILIGQEKYAAQYAAEKAAAVARGSVTESKPIGLMISVGVVVVSILFGGYMTFFRAAPAAAPGAISSAAPPAANTAQANSNQNMQEFRYDSNIMLEEGKKARESMNKEFEAHRRDLESIKRGADYKR
jgi:hypothetical protein